MDHLIPLELGGSTTSKICGPSRTIHDQGMGKRISWRTNFTTLFARAKYRSAKLQKCIASDWVKCWVTNVVPKYGPEWAEANRHGW